MSPEEAVAHLREAVKNAQHAIESYTERNWDEAYSSIESASSDLHKVQMHMEDEGLEGDES